MSTEDDYDLEVRHAAFNDMVGVGWQLPDDDVVRLCFAIHALCCRLVVRAGPWEFYPEVRYKPSWRCKYPDLRVRLGDLRDACRAFARERTELEGIEGLGPASNATAETVKVRFGPSGVTVRFSEACFDLKGE